MQEFWNRRRNKARRDKVSNRLRIEELEPRLMFHFDPTGGGDAAPLSPAELALAQQNQAGAGAFNNSPFPAISYTTLANGMPVLSSYPSAPADIFLDFDGDTTTNTSAYDIDGTPTTFGTAEQRNIVEAWREVSVYFAMFNVNVTTIQPAAGRSVAWMVIGNSIVGGYSYVNVFPNSDPNSFDESGDTTSRVSAFAHEIGHNFGNWHTSTYDDLGNKTAEYAGQFDPLHGPIMGLDWDGVIHKWTIWHRSLNDATGLPDAATIQDDMSYMASDLAALVPGSDGYRVDDYGGTIATATPLTLLGTTQAATGIIERLTDSDAFSFTSSGGTYNISVGRDTPSGVDVKVSVYDAAGNLLAGEDGDPRTIPYTMVNDSELTMNLPAGTFYVIVSSHGNYDDQGQYIVRVDPLSTNWQAQDIGLTGVPGYANYNAGTYTVAGSGSDIYGTNDAFQYAYQTLSGNGSITVLINSMDDTAAWAKAGIMFRDSLADNAKEAYVVMTPENGAQWSWRTSTGGSTGATTPHTGTAFAATWLRLVRSGNTITAYTAPLNGNFTQVGSSVSVSFGSTIYVGLAVSAVNNEQVTKASFSNVSVTGNLNVAPTLNAISPPTTVTTSTPTATSVSLSWNAAVVPGDLNSDGSVDTNDFAIMQANWMTSGPGDINGDGVVDLSDFTILRSNLGSAGPSGYSVERSSDGINFTSVGTTVGNVLTFTDNGLADDQRYFYRVRAIGAGGSISQSSPVTTGTTRAGAISNLNVISYSPTELVLDWTDASGESSYRIERSANGLNGWTSVGTNAKNVPIFANTGLTANTQYFYRVVTIDSAGDSATSSVISGYTRLSAITGLAFTSKASNQLVLQWNAVSGATTYGIERSTDGTTWSNYVSSLTATTFTDTGVAPLGEYYYRVTAYNANTQSASAVIFAAAPPATALPSPWVSQDIGTVGGAGAAGLTGSTFTVVGSGRDIYYNADEFQFVYVPFTGNATIIARVASMQDTNAGAKAGIMIRDSLTAGSKEVSLVATPDNGPAWEWRTSTNGNTSATTTTAAAFEAIWLKIVKTNSSYTAFTSTDGATWTQFGAAKTMTTTGTDYLGLAVSSLNDTLLNSATFDSVNTTPTGLVGGGSGTGAISETPSFTSAGSSSTVGDGSLAAAQSPIARVLSSLLQSSPVIIGNTSAIQTTQLSVATISSMHGSTVALHSADSYAAAIRLAFADGDLSRSSIYLPDALLDDLTTDLTEWPSLADQAVKRGKPLLK